MKDVFSAAYQNLIKKLDADIQEFLSTEEEWWLPNANKDMIMHLCSKPSNRGLYIKDKERWLILFNIDYLKSKNLFCVVCRSQCPSTIIDIHKLRKQFE